MSIENICNLTEYEKYIYNLTLSGDENVIGIGKLEAKFNVSQQELSINIVKKALYFMFKRHPLFRARVKKCSNSNKYFFEIHDETSRNENMMEFEYENFETLLFDEKLMINKFEIFMSKQFNYNDNNCLLWKFKLLKFNYGLYAFALVLPLYITDGLNITVLCMEICNLINSLISSRECEEMINKLPLIDNMYDLIEKQNIKIDIEKLIYNEKIINFNFPYLFRTLSNDNGNLTKMNLLKIDADRTIQILNESKRRKIRMSGYLIIVALKALKKLYNEFNIEIQRDFSCLLPANLRFRMKPEIEFCNMRFLVVLISINLFYPKINFENDNDIEQLWENAKYINEIIAEKTKFENGSLLQYSHNFKFIDEVNKIFDEFPIIKTPSALNRYNFCDFLLSNLGTYASDRKKLIDGDYKLTEIYHGDCLQSNPSNFSAFMLHVCTFNNQFMFQLSTNRNIFGPEYADRFMEIFKSILENSI